MLSGRGLCDGLGATKQLIPSSTLAVLRQVKKSSRFIRTAVSLQPVTSLYPDIIKANPQHPITLF